MSVVCDDIDKSFDDKSQGMEVLRNKKGGKFSVFVYAYG